MPLYLFFSHASRFPTNLTFCSRPQLAPFLATSCIHDLSKQFSSIERAGVFFRSSRDAAEPLIRGLRQPPVDSDPTSHQAVPAEQHQPQVSGTANTHCWAQLFNLLLYVSIFALFVSQPGAFLPNTDLRLWELWCPETVGKWSGGRMFRLCSICSDFHGWNCEFRHQLHFMTWPCWLWSLTGAAGQKRMVRKKAWLST